MVVLVVQDIPTGKRIDGHSVAGRELSDLNRMRSYMRDMARRHGVPIFDKVADAIHFIVEDDKKIGQQNSSQNERYYHTLESRDETQNLPQSQRHHLRRHRPDKRRSGIKLDANQIQKLRQLNLPEASDIDSIQKPRPMSKPDQILDFRQLNLQENEDRVASFSMSNRAKSSPSNHSAYASSSFLPEEKPEAYSRKPKTSYSSSSGERSQKSGSKWTTSLLFSQESSLLLDESEQIQVQKWADDQADNGNAVPPHTSNLKHNRCRSNVPVLDGHHPNPVAHNSSHIIHANKSERLRHHHRFERQTSGNIKDLQTSYRVSRSPSAKMEHEDILFQACANLPVMSVLEHPRKSKKDWSKKRMNRNRWRGQQQHARPLGRSRRNLFRFVAPE